MKIKNNNIENSASFLTWNLYLGADLEPVLKSNIDQLPGTVSKVFEQFLSTNIKKRMKEVAKQIASQKPDIIGVQEASLWQLSVPNLPTVTYDSLSMLLNELKKKKLYYYIASKSENAFIRLPTNQGNRISFLDRDVILVRKLPCLKVVHTKSAHYKSKLKINIGDQPYEIPRGWSLVDIKIKNQVFRVINTHLESASLQICTEQGRELLNGPTNTALPTILMGDFNTTSKNTIYNEIMQNGFQDAWVDDEAKEGSTCCQDHNLLNPKSTLYERIDFVFHKNGWTKIKSNLIGQSPKSRTSDLHWSSDHAGIFSKLILQ
jgi:endonuclease/exonuclease/phosphatase family metal-dependent hydrolase